MNNIMIEQIKGLLTEENMIAALANVSSCIMLNYKNLNWSGFYFKTDKDLVLGPFQGKPACTHIPFEKGVCGKTYREKSVQRVDDVLNFQDHIACDSASRSELCVPVIIDDECKIIIDLDAPVPSRFSEKEEKEMLEVSLLIKEAYLQHHWAI